MVVETRASKRKRSDSVASSGSSTAPAATTRRVTRAASAAAAAASASEAEIAPPVAKRARKAPAPKPKKAKKTNSRATSVASTAVAEPIQGKELEAPVERPTPLAAAEMGGIAALGEAPKTSLRNPLRTALFKERCAAWIKEKEDAAAAAEKAEKEAAEAVIPAETTPVPEVPETIPTPPAPTPSFLSRLISTVSSPFRPSHQIPIVPQAAMEQPATPPVPLRAPEVATLKRKRVEHQVAVLTTISESPEVFTPHAGLIPRAAKVPQRRRMKDARAARARRQEAERARLAQMEQQEPVVERKTKRVKVDHLKALPHNRPGDPEGCFRAPDIDDNSEMEVDMEVTVLTNPFEFDDEPTPKKAKLSYDYGFSYSDNEASDAEPEIQTHKTPQQLQTSPIHPATAPAKIFNKKQSPVQPPPIIIPDDMPGLSSGPTSADTEDEEFEFPYLEPRDPNEPESSEEYKEMCGDLFARGLAHWEATGEFIDF